ncbi:MAG: hypothetical protein KatS3mg019_2201 [Fimbriimonadales bacterium]|nr:MAG: hypothetical protein KatS3mg019_2201 [Fimbriimonadales bacterium]
MQEIPPITPAPGLPPAWGASAGVYGGVVNLGNGNLCLQIPLTGWANGVSFSLVFNSQANPSQPSPIAPKWTHNWHVFLTLSSTQRQATVQEGDGSRWVYNDPDGDGVFTAPTGVFDRLVRQSDGRYVLTRRGSEERWVFASQNNAQGMCVLERVEDKYARAVVLSYVNGRLSQITDRYGRALSLTYTNNRLWQVVDFTGRVWDLMYDGQGRLQKVRFPAVQDENNQSRLYEITLGYNSRGNVIRWTDRRGQTWQYEYLSATSDVLKWFRDPAGNQWTASYSNAVPVGIQSLGTLENGSSRWTDPTGVWVEYGFAAPTVVRLTQGGNATPLRLTTRLWYNGQYQVIKRQDSAGLVWEWNYDPQGNLLWSKEPNGAQTSYTYYPNSDRVWKVTDALNHTWEYTYTDVGDVKSVKDPENAATSYVYDYELNEPAYGQVRRVIDPLGRTTEYQYYAADEANWARRGQVKKVIAPGGYWREMDYGGAGWLTRRTVQTGEITSETTLYTYDAWGRLRGIDYPRSADVSMGWDGENRRVWVQDGAGRREYTYDAWGRVREQRGCCGETNEVITYFYDTAGRSEGFTDPTGRRVIYQYNPLGRLEYAKDERGRITFIYDTAGRLQQYQYPDGSRWVYSYHPTTGELERKQLWNAQGERDRDYILRYDLRHRLQRSEEQLRGEVLKIRYDDANRTVTEQRSGEWAYTRTRVYNADGSLQSEYYASEDVQSWFLYMYDEVGRLEQIVDLLRGGWHLFHWAGMRLAQWEASDRSYRRLLRYDEEGRIVEVERQDMQTGEVRPGLAYQYRWGGGIWYKRDYMRGLEFRETCGGFVSWYREEGSSDWQVGVQAYFGQGVLCCGGSGGNRVVMNDALWMPNEFEVQMPALCAAACACGIVCLAYVVLPCLGRVSGALDPLQCLLDCINERIVGMPGWGQLVCRICVAGCALCILRSLPQPGLPFTPAPVPSPAPMPAPAPILSPGLAWATAAAVSAPCDPPVAPPPPPPAPPAGPQPPKSQPHPQPQPEPNPPWHPQPRPYEPPPWFSIDPIPPFLPDDDEWCQGICDSHCRERIGLPDSSWEWLRCFSGCLKMCTGSGWLPDPNDPFIP